ncbi:pilus assembly protein TadG-related protein [Mesorhizobium sp. WSM2239]|uniref:Pilus assembly protein TadG-related protein n=2 Tax=unclassified Mesorhizobium TaxID=325217 RepID=A0AAU8D722_9HYPH
MLRRFARDQRGNFAMMMVIATVPILGGLALAVDYSELSRQRQIVLNALDAAAVATGAHIISGSVSSADPVAYETAIKKYAQDFFVANLGPVKPTNTTLSVGLPNNNAGGGTLKLTAGLKYEPYFLPAFTELIGQPRDQSTVNVAAKSEVRLKNTLEVALVLDNSGSMAEYGSGTGQQRIVLLKAAAKQLVETMANQAAMMKQVPKPVQFGLVPFAASVNIAPDNDAEPWMDTKGISPVHHENFDWSTMTAARDPNKYAEKVGDVWYKRGVGWGETKDQPLTRFSLYADIIAETGREEVPGSRHCVKWWSNGTCRQYSWDYTYITSQFASWQGCIEARPAPYNNNDATPTSSNPATLFVPMFAPDEPKHLWRDLDRDGVADLNADDFYYSNNWWTDWADTAYTTAGAVSRLTDMRKYFRVKPFGSTNPDSGDGPNSSCTTNPITPLHDVTTAEGKKVILGAIDSMKPGGNTNVPEGTAWGWRVVSHGAPFTEGRPEIEKGNDKVIIVLTDGANTYGDLSDNSGYDLARLRSTYAAYGYTGKGYNGTGITRMFMDTSGNVGKSTYTSTNYQAAMDEQLQMVCANAKAPDQGNIIVVTVSLDLSTSVASEKKAIEALTKCASDSRFKKNADGTPKKLFYNATGSNLAEKFKEIADELSNLRIVG